MKKKAFTLSEALVTVAIIGVLAAILIPVVNNVKPDKDKITYKKALYSMQAAVSTATDKVEYEIAANAGAYWNDENVTSDPSTFCREVADALNTSGAVHCESSYKSSYDNPNFITTDGIRYWGLESAIPNKGYKTIYVDRNLSSGELSNLASSRGRSGEGMQIRVRYDGKVDIPDGTATSYEKELIDKSFEVVKK